MRITRVVLCRIHANGLLCVAALLGAPEVSAQSFPLTSAEVADSAALAGSMPRLAAEVLATYEDADRPRFLDNLFRLQILSGRYPEAAASLAELRGLRRDPPPQTRARYVQYEIFVRAKNLAASSGRPFAEAFAEAFRDRFAELDDPAAALAARTILLSPGTVANDLRWATPDQTGKTTVSLEDALTLLHVYQAVESYRGFAGLAEALVAEDDARRYVIEPNVPVETPDGATVCAIIVRPRAARDPLPTLLQFTIYADSIASMREALLAAANGYVGVTGYTRGKVCSPDVTVPYVHDGADAAALIDWIAAQPWSDGRVGMYGGSYSGFTAWSAAKHTPAALKAIMVGAPVAPGIDVPMEGNVFWNFVYPWPFYTTNDRWLDTTTYNDNARWNRLYQEWYRSGRPYRELEVIDGTPNPVFAEWIAHPAVDAYWRAMIPQGEEYERITIPVLQTAGYFFGGPGAAVYYFREHSRHNPQATHYLLIGPYDHFQAQRGVVTALGDTATYFAGYEIDPVARIDIVADLRFQWFDYALNGGPKPPLLGDRVNYQVMGENVWRSAPSIAAMSNDRLRLYFDPVPVGTRYTLSGTPPAGDSFIPHTVDLADRSDADAGFFGGLVAAVIDTSNAITLVSEPLPEAVEANGLLSGHLELVTNKRDFDFTITPYEWTEDGQYFQLPPYTVRASHAGSAHERRLLSPDDPERLDFEGSIRMVSRRLRAGSRIVIVLSIVKSPLQQINYGTGGDVSDESMADVGEPLSIRWLAGSFVELPVRR
ncbi:MAG TPA: CocE/NonD family hydrolase [Gemmatimonadota bacterium]|nr:CocE/NonD family hydrolase [Gemmatimonadota bacterium]